MMRWVFRSIEVGGTVYYISFQPVLHNWRTKGCGIYCPVCGMMYVNNNLLLIEKCSPRSDDSGFPLSLSDYPLPHTTMYIVNKNILSVIK